MAGVKGSMAGGCRGSMVGASVRGMAGLRSMACVKGDDAARGRHFTKGVGYRFGNFHAAVSMVWWVLQDRE